MGSSYNANFATGIGQIVSQYAKNVTPTEKFVKELATGFRHKFRTPGQEYQIVLWTNMKQNVPLEQISSTPSQNPAITFGCLNFCGAASNPGELHMMAEQFKQYCAQTNQVLYPIDAHRMHQFVLWPQTSPGFNRDPKAKEALVCSIITAFMEYRNKNNTQHKLREREKFAQKKADHAAARTAGGRRARTVRKRGFDGQTQQQGTRNNRVALNGAMQDTMEHTMQDRDDDDMEGQRKRASATPHVDNSIVLENTFRFPMQAWAQHHLQYAVYAWIPVLGQHLNLPIIHSQGIKGVIMFAGMFASREKANEHAKMLRDDLLDNIISVDVVDTGGNMPWPPQRTYFEKIHVHDSQKEVLGKILQGAADNKQATNTTAFDQKFGEAGIHIDNKGNVEIRGVPKMEEDNMNDDNDKNGDDMNDDDEGPSEMMDV